jgi:hypothetical protein
MKTSTVNVSKIYLVNRSKVRKLTKMILSIKRFENFLEKRRNYKGNYGERGQKLKL